MPVPWYTAATAKSELNLTVTTAGLDVAREQCLRVKGLALTTLEAPSKSFAQGVVFQALANAQSAKADERDEFGSVTNGVRLYPMDRKILAMLIIPSPAGVIVDPVTVTWPDGSTVALSRENDIVTAVVSPGDPEDLPGGTQPLPTEFTPTGFVHQLAFASTDAAGPVPGKYLLTIIEDAGAATVQLMPSGGPGPYQPFAARWLADPLVGADGPTRDNGLVGSLVG
jgi:hypothetical protein